MKKIIKKESKQKYIVYDKIIETADTSTLRLIFAGETLPHYIPGQFITVYFPETGTPEGKAYSISSAPSEGMITISVKAIGKFSNRLIAMGPGDTITASLPCGYFYSESNQTALVMISAGIGVAPFRSIIIDALEKNPGRKIILLYSSKTVSDIIFKKEFDKLQTIYSNFKIKYFITRQQNIHPGMINQRINEKNILDNIENTLNTEFLICGSISFTRDMWHNLRALGISTEMIYTEAFFSH